MTRRPNPMLAHLRCTGRCEADMDCECELANDVAPDPDRVIRAPTITPEDRAAVARIRRLAVVLAIAAFSGLAALLGIADQRFVP